MKELENCDIPTVGVTARPLESSIFTWHGNLRGPEGTPYQGGVFHIEMVFDELYPHKPPTVRLFTDLPHPNVFGRDICLDMLDGKKKILYQGWTSAYSVSSILLQLQSFLFEQHPDQEQKIVSIKQAVKRANEFSCSSNECKHQGPIAPWPPFSQKETNLGNFVMLKNESQRLQEEVVCFHTRSVLKDSTLGIGVSVGRLPRTGEIRSVTPTLDLVSLKAFIKDGVRQSLSNERFTHWLPIYLGDNPDKYLKMTKKALSMICTGSTKKFNEAHILEVMPKLLMTMVVDMMSEATHTSILALRGFAYFVRLFRFMLYQYPEEVKKAQLKVEAFVRDPANRIKDNTPNLGDLLGISLVLDNFDWPKFMDAYLGEQLDRNVFWILQAIPELDEKNADKKGGDAELDENRAEVSFKAQTVGYYITLYYNAFQTTVLKAFNGENTKFDKQVDAHYGRLAEEMEDDLQGQCENIRRVKNFFQYYAMLGQTKPTPEDMNNRLKQAVANSRAKGYHGCEDALNQVPEFKEQVVQVQGTYPTVKKMLTKDKTLPEAGDACWKDSCMKRYSWIKDIFNDHSDAADRFTPDYLAAISDRRKMNSRNSDPILEHRDKALKGFLQHQEQFTKFDKYSKGVFSWRDLFVKLDFEDFIELFQYSADFKELYEYVGICAPFLTSIILPTIQRKHLKSGHYWVMVLLTKLTKLKTFIFRGSQQYPFSQDGFKFFLKGFANFKANGGSLEKFQMISMNANGIVCEEKFLQVLKCIPTLRVLTLRYFTVNKNIASYIGRILSDFKQISELDLRDCNMNQDAAKEVADGLMRAK